jgi:NAD(P)-dependent dehydrogenase (short-subunit alcohol dehydrogenase family)
MLDGLVAIVTGGSGDLGRGVCRALSKAGASVVSLDIVAGPPPEDGVLDLTCDITDAERCTSVVEEVVERYGGVDVLVNMAQQIFIGTPLLELPDESMRRSFESGPIATLRMMRLCHPSMKARGGGAVVNFASGAGTAGLVYTGPYASAKEAIRGITKVAANEWGPDNIRVNAVCPMGTADPGKDWARASVEKVPLGRMGDPETDIGSAVVFLAGSGCFITGRTLQVDGGAGSYH